MYSVNNRRNIHSCVVIVVNGIDHTPQVGELVGNEIIARKVYAEIPPRVEYSLTAKGKSIIPVMESVQSSQLVTYGDESPHDAIMNLNLD